MTNHPNRSGRHPSANPSGDDILALRKQCGLTQTQAAALVHSSERTWQQWEHADRRMHPGLWELFQRKIGVYSERDEPPTSPQH